MQLVAKNGSESDRDILNRSIEQAHAMVHAIVGDDPQQFGGLDPEVQQNYLWALMDRLNEARAALRKA